MLVRACAEGSGGAPRSLEEKPRSVCQTRLLEAVLLSTLPTGTFIVHT